MVKPFSLPLARVAGFAFVAVLVALVALTPAQPGSGKPDPEKPLPEGAAAVVNGEVIPIQQVYEALYRQHGEAMLSQMVKAALARQEAKRLGLQLDEKAVTKRVEEWKKSFLARFNNDEAAADRMLRQQGATYANTLAIMRAHNETETLWSQIARAKRKPDWKALRATFDQRFGDDGERIEVAHIVLSANPSDPRFADRYPEKEHYRNIDSVEAKAAALAKDVAARARKGEDFAKLALAHSDDWSKNNGGSVGAYWQNRFGKPFEEAVRDGKIGDIVGPVQFRDGFLVAKIEPAEFDTSVEARHIFLAFTGKKSHEAVLARAAALKAEIANGADFAELARKVSQDPLTSENGGLWEPFKASDRVAQIASALESLQPGQVTDPIPTPYGVHLIQLVKRSRTPKGTKKAVAIVLISTQYAQVREKHLRPVIEAEKKAAAESVLRQLEAGADFGVTARKFSNEQYTAQRGGVIHSYDRNRISPEFHALVKSLKAGQVAKAPILTPHGFHVVKVISRDKTDFESVKQEMFAEQQKSDPTPAEIQRVQQEIMHMAKVQKRQ